MGTCVSKCYPSPPSLTDCDSPNHDKLTISPHTITTTTNSTLEMTKPSKVHPSPTSTTSSSSSSSSSASSSTSSTITSLSSSSSTSTSSSCATSNATFAPGKTPKDRPFSSEFLLACAKENFDVVVLDPKKPLSAHDMMPTTRPHKLPMPVSTSTTQAARPSFAVLRGPPSPRQAVKSRAITNQSFPSKRARSVSPMSRAGRKRSVRTEPSPMGAATASERRNVSNKTSSVLRSATEREVFLPHVHRVEAMASRDVESREVFLSKKRARGAGGACEQEPPLVEDLNNPLISMDCFIFL